MKYCVYFSNSISGLLLSRPPAGMLCQCPWLLADPPLIGNLLKIVSDSSSAWDMGGFETQEQQFLCS